jgi:hypothetical protein
MLVKVYYKLQLFSRTRIVKEVDHSRCIKEPHLVVLIPRFASRNNHYRETIRVLLILCCTLGLGRQKFWQIKWDFSDFPNQNIWRKINITRWYIPTLILILEQASLIYTNIFRHFLGCFQTIQVIICDSAKPYKLVRYVGWIRIFVNKCGEGFVALMLNIAKILSWFILTQNSC